MKISWNPGARQDLHDIVSYISNDSPAAALRVAQRIENRIRQLAYFPDAGRPGKDDFRELAITKTPYLALFRRLDDEIEIVSIVHGARDR